MIRSLSKYILLLICALATFGCNKTTENTSDLDKLRNSTNRNSYPITSMDSLEAINFITKQKIQELIDLSTLYSNGHKDTEIDTVIYNQMTSYFSNPDSLQLRPILSQLESLKVKTAKVGDLKIEKKVKGKDTIEYANFTVEYFNKENKSLGTFNKTAEYTLKLTPVKFKKEFKFYFLNFDLKPKDSTSVGVTK